MVTWPSGKAKVCKTFIHQFKSGRHLHMKDPMQRELFIETVGCVGFLLYVLRPFTDFFEAKKIETRKHKKTKSSNEI